jgi:hypothetical protein
VGETETTRPSAHDNDFQVPHAITPVPAKVSLPQ